MSATATTMDSETTIASAPFARTWSREAVAWSVILFSQVPLLLLHFRRLWLFDHYQYFPFVLGAFLFFTWKRWPKDISFPRDATPKLESFLTITALAILAISTLFWAPWLSAVAGIFSIGAAVVHFGGRQAVRQLLSVWLLLWFVMPLPFSLDAPLVFWLQTVASNAASYLLDFFGINHLLSGHVLEVPQHRFMVEEACSGIQSLFALLAFAAILGIGLRRSLIHVGLMLIAAVFWATSINIIRVAAVVAAFAWFEVDLAAPWRHEILGLVLNGFAILMLLCTDQQVLFLLERPEHDDDFQPDFFEDDLLDDADSEADNLSTGASRHIEQILVNGATNKLPTRFQFTLVLALLFSIVGAVQTIVMVLKFDARQLAGEASNRLTSAFQASTLPSNTGSWKQIGFKNEGRSLISIHGSRSSVWSYGSEDAAAIVHINYPFMGWHNLPKCFKGQGWRIKSFERAIPQSVSGTDAGAFKLELDKPNGEVMHVRFCQFNLLGEPVLPPAGGKLTSWLTTVFDNSAGQWSWLGVDVSTYQVVMQVTPKGPSMNTPQEALTADFMQFRERLVGTVLRSVRSDD